MDEYKHYVYQRDADAYAKIDPGDLTIQKYIRQRLQCKSFKWFMENVAYDIPKVFPMVEPANYAAGAIQSAAYPNLCVDSLNIPANKEIGIWDCGPNTTHPYGNQMFVLTGFKDIRNGDRNLCWEMGSNAAVRMVSCHRQGGNQFWRYDYVYASINSHINRKIFVILIYSYFVCVFSVSCCRRSSGLYMSRMAQIAYRSMQPHACYQFSDAKKTMMTCGGYLVPSMRRHWIIFIPHRYSCS